MQYQDIINTSNSFIPGSRLVMHNDAISFAIEHDNDFRDSYNIFIKNNSCALFSTPISQNEALVLHIDMRYLSLVQLIFVIIENLFTICLHSDHYTVHQFVYLYCCWQLQYDDSAVAAWSRCVLAVVRIVYYAFKPLCVPVDVPRLLFPKFL